MCNVPPKFYQLCRLCLSIDKDGVGIFEDAGAHGLPTKIMTCLSILVRVIHCLITDRAPLGQGRPRLYFQPALIIPPKHLPVARGPPDALDCALITADQLGYVKAKIRP